MVSLNLFSQYFTFLVATFFSLSVLQLFAFFNSFPPIKEVQNDTLMLNKKDNLFFNISMSGGKNPYFHHSFWTTKLVYLPEVNNFTYHPLLSLNYLISDSREYAFSLGCGLRDYFPYLKKTLGMNIFCDIKHFNLDNFYQIGAGFESLSFFELRANFYVPIIRARKSQVFYLFNSTKLIESKSAISLSGCEVEIGKRIHKNFLDLYFSIAPYCIFNEGFGIEYKTQVRWKSILYLGLTVYQHFACSSRVAKGAGETIVGIMGLNIPLGVDSSTKKSAMRIPIYRWDTIRTCVNTTYKEKKYNL